MFLSNKAVYLLLASAVLVAALAFAACGDDDGDGGDGAGAVNVSLTEFQVSPDVTSASAGDVEFVATNDGVEVHELVVVRTDLAPDSLPAEDGKVLEDAEGLEFIGEIEEFDPGNTEEATFNLEPGNYVLFCNIVEEEEGGETESHYEEGMFTGFTVE